MDAAIMTDRICRAAAVARAEDRGRVELMLEQIEHLKKILSELLAGAQSSGDTMRTLAVIPEYSQLLATELNLIRMKRRDQP